MTRRLALVPYARRAFGAVLVGLLASTAPSFAQSTDPQKHQHPAPTPDATRWHLMQDGVVYGLFNHQGGPRGGDEFVVPNWWMGMWMRGSGRNQFGINAMLSLDPATIGSQGYREIFQVGEVYEGKPLIDHQHPHDFLMQLSGLWRRTFGSTDVVVTGALAGEPTLGPVAFMHRPSAAGLPLAPLGHHTFDATHLSFGVITAGVERGPWVVEGSVFNGREPDEHRWGLEFAALDSYAGRVWFKPGAAWAFQVSAGKLSEPEELIPGDAVRTTASGSWFRQDPDGFRAITIGYGVNSSHGEERHGVFGELTVEKGANGFSGRIERQQVETEVLITGEVPSDDDDEHGPTDPSAVTAFTLTGARRLLTWKGFEGAVGAQAVFYQVPDALRQTHGLDPFSYQVFFRLRLPATGMGRMWDMVMSQGHK
jgi:hypothetical protein